MIPTLDRSGAEKQFSLLASQLPRDEFDVHVLALTRGGPYAEWLSAREVPVTVLHKRWKFDPFALHRLRQALDRLQPDILHTWLFAANAYGRLAVRRRAHATPRVTAPLETSPRVIVSERCVDTWKAGWQTWLDRRLISRTDRLVANSESVAAHYRQQGFPSERMAIIRNGVERPDSAPPDRAALLRELRLPANAVLIGHVGRLARQKRVDDLLWAIQVLRQADPRAYLLVIGDGPERERLVQHARDVESAEHVRFLGLRGDAFALIGLLDVFWLGSDFEGQSNSLMEAMSWGVPSVVTDIPPNRELITQDVEGYLVPVGDGVGFAQFTRRLMQDASLARRVGEAARQRMASNFSVRRMVEAHCALYREVLGPRP